jgi:hypothetical protein
MEIQATMSSGSAKQSEQLFPRLPDEITLGLIVPKLLWRTFHLLAAVSPAWRQAIKLLQVRDAAIQSASTDSLVLHGRSYLKVDGLREYRLAVYAMRHERCYDLPPIPGHCMGIPKKCGCI